MSCQVTVQCKQLTTSFASHWFESSMLHHMTPYFLPCTIAFFANITLERFLKSMIVSSVLHILTSGNETLVTILTIVFVVLQVHMTLVPTQALIISKCLVAKCTLRFQVFIDRFTTFALSTSCFLLWSLHCLIYICCSVVRCK